MPIPAMRFRGLDIWVSTSNQGGIPDTYGFDLVDSRSPSIQPPQVRINQVHMGTSGLVHMLTRLLDNGKTRRAMELLPLVLGKVLNFKGFDSVEVDNTPQIEEGGGLKTTVMEFLNRHRQGLLQASRNCSWYVVEDPEPPSGRKLITNIYEG